MSSDAGQGGRQPPEPREQADSTVWSFRGYQLRPGDFTTSMVHLFRGEIARANVWRQRLDSTTNWAVITTGAALSFAFGSNVTSHVVIILSILLTTLFLGIEARRYRYYEMWSYRIRLMETDFFAAMLVPPFGPAPDWSESLAENLLHPRFPISMWEAVGRRLRRNYLWIYIVLGLAWLFNVTLRPTSITSWADLAERSAIGGLPGHVVLAAGAAFYTAVLLVSILTRGLHEATGEILPRYGNGGSAMRDALESAGSQAAGRRASAWFRPSRRRQQLLSHIITDHPEAVARRVLAEMHRGVTRLEGTGMYTGKPRPMLLCALTVTEVAHLKALVKEADPNAFVIVIPAQEVLGEGFIPLREE
ncbi:MAG: hypothetical protein Kow00124_15360 [Anaerolineae bacterium]